MNDLTDIQTRFPALSDGWARFDGPAGTQVVDTAIEAMSDWQRSGRNANSHGAFPAAQACDDLVDETSKIMGELLSADPVGMTFGPSTTANMMALTRAVAVDLKPEDEITTELLAQAKWIVKTYFKKSSLFLLRLRIIPLWRSRKPRALSTHGREGAI